MVPDADRTSRRPILPILLGVAGLAAVVMLVSGRSAPFAPAPAPPGGTTASALPSTRAVLGQHSAKVVIAEFGDFQCTSCGAFFRTIEPQVRVSLLDTGIARLEWHDFPWIGQESRDAANAARCAGDQGRFWELHDLLYRSQSGENQGAFSKARLKAMGTQLGLDADAFAACVDGNLHGAAVQADLADVRSKGFNSTPTFLVGNQRIVGAQPFAVFQAAVNAQLGAR